MTREPILMSPLKVAETFLGIREVDGAMSDPTVMSMLKRVAKWPEGDHVAWCSAFIAACNRPLGLPQTHSLRARSWLTVGTRIPLDDAEPGFDLVVFRRSGSTLDPDVLDEPGHVAWFEGLDGDRVRVLGGNQGNRVSRTTYRRADVIAVQRL